MLEFLRRCGRSEEVAHNSFRVYCRVADFAAGIRNADRSTITCSERFVIYCTINTITHDAAGVEAAQCTNCPMPTGITRQHYK